MMDYAGMHCTADIWLSTPIGDDAMLAHCEAAIAESGMQVVAATYKKFSPQGMTAIWILQESHFTLHTKMGEQGFNSLSFVIFLQMWVDYGYALCAAILTTQKVTEH